MNLQLYHRWHCPYSARVRGFVDEQNLGAEIEYVELGEVEGAETKLTELTGGTQVPCLVVDGRPILESAEIVQWLRSNLSSAERGAQP
jgi:glutathione S-transferase